MFVKEPEAIKNLQEYINQSRWTEILNEAYILCAKYAGIKLADEVKAIDFDYYKDDLKDHLLKSLDIAKSKSCKVICYTLETTGDWTGCFLIYKDYVKRSNDNFTNSRNGWDHVYDEEVEMPRDDKLSEIYLRQSGILKWKKKRVVFTYLMIRIMFILNELANEMRFEFGEVALISYWESNGKIYAIKE